MISSTKTTKQNKTLFTPQKPTNKNAAKHVRILLAEDNLQDYLREMTLLEKSLNNEYNFTFDQVATYGDAHGLLRKNDYSLILLDYAMEDGNGMDLAKQIHEYNLNTPVVFMMENQDAKIMEEAKQYGVEDCLIKDEMDLASFQTLADKYFKNFKAPKTLFLEKNTTKSERVQYFEGLSGFMNTQVNKPQA